MRTAFVPLVRDLFNRFANTNKTIWNQLSEGFISTVLTHQASVLFIYRHNTSDTLTVRDMFDPSQGIWGSQEPAKCPAKECCGNLEVTSRTKKHSLCFLCPICKRESAYISMPGDIYRVKGSSLWSRGFPAMMSVENHIWGQWQAGYNRGKTLPKEHSNFTRKLDVSRMPIFNVAKKNARMKSETQAPRSRHADVRKHKRKSEGEVQGGDGGHGNKRARM